MARTKPAPAQAPSDEQFRIALAQVAAESRQRGEVRGDAFEVDASKHTERARSDGWVNAYTGFGTSRDVRTYGYHQTIPVTCQEAEDLWRGNDLAARIVETLPNEATREGWELSIADVDGSHARVSAKRAAPAGKQGPPGSAREAEPETAIKADGEGRAKGIASIVADEWERLDVIEAVWEALAYSRAYGGGAILLGTNDGVRDYSQPLDPSKARDVYYLHALEARELIPWAWYTDPLSPKYGRPALYQLNPQRGGLPVEEHGTKIGSTTFVHESRVVAFDGIRVSRLQSSFGTYGWGDSVFTRVKSRIQDFDQAFDSTGVLIKDFAQGVYKIQGLAELLAQGGSLAERMREIDLTRSTLRAIAIDAENEDFRREQTPVSGLPDLIDRFMQRLAAAADMPVTVLMGMSPAGLNATGDSDVRLFYDRVAAFQRRKLGRALRRITEVIMSAKGLTPKRWQHVFNPLWQPTDKEVAEARKIQADADAVYLDRSVISPEEVAINRFGGAEFSFETKIDLNERDEHEAIASDPTLDPTIDPVTGEPIEPVLGEDGKPVLDPKTGAPLAAGAPGIDLQKTAMNGTQVTSLLEVIRAVNTQEISRESGIGILELAFALSPADAERVLGPKHEPPKPEPPPMLPGAGGAPPFGAKPGAPPDDAKGEAPKGEAPKGGGDNPFAKGGDK